MSLAKVNKRNKLMWDNTFQPIGNSNINATTYNEPATIVGYVEGKPVYRRFLVRTLSAKSIEDGYYGFSLVPEGETCMILSANASIIPENAPITSTNHPHYIGCFNGFNNRPTSTVFIHVYQTSPRAGRLAWGTNVPEAKEGAVVYFDFTYVKFESDEEPVKQAGE